MFQFLNFKTHIQKTWERFPFSLITSFLGSLIAVISIGLEVEEPIIWKALMVCVLATFSFSSYSVWQESREKKNGGVLIAVLLFLIGFGWFSIPYDVEAANGSLWAIRYAVVTLLSFLALTFIPYINTKEETNKSLWSYNQRYWTQLLTTYFSGAILFLGLLLALFALDKLFGVNIDEKIYLQIWVLIVGVFGTTFFLSKFPKPLEEKTIETPPYFISFVTRFILTPLVGLYLVILYAYTAKVLFTWTWPNNLVGWLIIIFLMIGVLTYILWTPFHTNKTEKWKKPLWIALVPQIIVLFFSVGLRIQQYSWTESRYIVVVLALWLLCIAGYFIISKAGRLKVLLMSLVLTVLLTQLGPWSMYWVGKNAQIKRIKAYNLTDEASLIETRDDNEAVKEVRSIVNYLVDRHGVMTVAQIYPQIGFSNEMREWEAKDRVFDFFGIPSALYNDLEYKYVSLKESAMNVSGYDIFLANSRYAANNEAMGEWLFERSGNFIILYSPEGELSRIDITDFKADLEAKKDELQNQESEEILSYEFNTELGVEGKIVFRYANFREDSLDVSGEYVLLKTQE